MSKPITLYSHNVGPNPWKVAILMEELGLQYETKFLDMHTEVKAKPYTDINPNGRVPAIHDPNTGIQLWESGAIIEYLIDTYDKEGKLSYRNAPEKYLVAQWLFYQVSGQGPYFGQAAWFTNFHHERLPSATERYQKEVHRVTSVLNAALETSKTDYLVGNKCTYADLAFVTWASMAPFLLGGDEAKVKQLKEENPAYEQWMQRLMSRPAVKKVLEEKAKASGH